MAERKAVTKEMARRYRRASKKQKTVMLTELCELTGWERRHARRALKQALAPAPRPRKGARCGRRVIYDEETVAALRKVWAIYGFLCGKRLAPFLAEGVEALERCGELTLAPEVRDKLVGMSAATIDRRLAADRRKHQLKGRSGTKPGTLLRHQIPIRTFSEWDDARPGFCEADLVAHDGGNASGEFAQTLVLTCVASGWTEPRALQNKAQRWCHQALEEIAADLPVRLLGIDSDNGSEFINTHLMRWCEQERITFTRGRPYNKNDNCYVEQKNWSVVRQAVGYHRYDTSAELRTLTKLYALLRLYVNFFQPSQKLVSKTRQGAKVKRRHDMAQTPYRRLLASPYVSTKDKAALTRTYKRLNPAKLQREIVALQRHLLHLTARKPKSTPKGGGTPADNPFRRFSYGKRGSQTPVEARQGPSEGSGTRKRPGVSASGPAQSPSRKNPSTKKGKTSTRTSSVRQRSTRSRTS